MAECWSCGAEFGIAPFCGTCGAIQPVSDKLDFFSALGLEPKMTLERASLDRAFREASKKVHPDRFPREEPALRRLALAHTERVNEAYRTLKEPQKRAEYLLRLEGSEVAGETDRTDDPSLLMEMLEKQEKVQFARDPEVVAEMKAETKARYDGLMAIVADYFDNRTGDLASTRATLGELRYHRRMLDQIAQKEEELF